MSAPDLDMARRFLLALDEEAEGFTFQTFDDEKDRDHKAPSLVRVLHGSLDTHAEELQRLNARGAGIFVTANSTDLKGRSAENIHRVRALFVDLDGAPLPESWPLTPHLVIESSPGRWHAYWFADGCPLEKFSAVQAALAARFGGDPSVKDLPRVMRLPGFLHMKRKYPAEATPFPTHILDEEPGLPYSFGEFCEAFDIDPEAPAAPGPAGGAWDDLMKERPKLTEGVAEGERNATAASLAGKLIGKGMTPDEVLVALRGWNQDNKPHLSDTELRGVVASITKTHQRNHPEAAQAAGAIKGVSPPRGYRLSPEGVFQRGDGDDDDTRLTTCPVWVSALARNHEGTGWGHLVEWLDRDGAPHEAAFPAGRFHEEGAALARDLADAGLGIVPGKGRKLLAYLGSFDPAARFRSTPQLGWVDTPTGRLVYNLPGEVIEQHPDDDAERERVVFQPERFAPTTETMHAAGTLEEWQREVVEPCDGNPVLIYALARIFAPPLLKLARVEGGGEHWFGRSTGGKTTVAQVSASGWGCGADPAEAPAAAFVRKWNSTKNGTEGLAAAHNDGLLILDEIGEADARDFAKTVYMLAGGVGKVRMNDAANLRASRTWRVFLISTGETSARAILEVDGRAAKAGQLVRLADIPAEGPDGGLFHDTHGMEPAAFADNLKRACATCYGTAGPAFVRGLVEAEDDPDILRRELRAKVDRATADLTPPHAPPEVRRTIRRFALVDVAGTLACGMGVLSFTAEMIRVAVETVVARWLSERGMADDVDRAIEQVRAFILRNEARFRDTTRDEDAPPVRDLVGYRDHLGDRHLFTPAGFGEACEGFDPKAVARELVRREWLHKDQRDRYTSKATVQGIRERVSVYSISDKILSADHADSAARPGVSREATGQRDTSGTAQTRVVTGGVPVSRLSR